MSRLSSPSTGYRNQESGSALWIGWAVYGGIAFLGFCFGVWAGNQRPKPVEVVKPAAGDQANAKGGEKTDTNVPEPKGSTQASNKTNNPPPKKTETPPPKKADPMANVEPKKMDMPPEPKKVEPMPMTVTTSLTFDKDIKPIFRVNCQNCHGDTPKPKGDFDIRTIASIKKGGDTNNPGVTPGDPSKSSVWISIEDGTMPPAGSGKMLSAMDKKMIKEWIAGGAK